MDSQKRTWQDHDNKNTSEQHPFTKKANYSHTDSHSAQFQSQSAAQDMIQAEQQRFLDLIQQTTSQQHQQQPTSDNVKSDPAKRIYVGSLDYSLPEDIIRQNFDIFGEITKIDYPVDPATGYHKGFCFVEYATENAASAALASMDGHIIGGRSIKVRPPKGTRTGAGMPGDAQQNPTGPDLSKVVYVGSIPYYLPADKVREIFESFGPITSINMVHNPDNGLHRGFGFITYEHTASASAAINKMQGVEFHGRIIQVNYSHGYKPPTDTNDQSSKQSISGESRNPSFGETSLDDKTSATTNVVKPIPKDATNIILLRNLLTVDEYELEDKAEFEEEVMEQCQLYGRVGRIVVHISSKDDQINKNEKEMEKEKDEKDGFRPSLDIYVSYLLKDHAISAQEHINEREFGKNLVSATFVDRKQFQKILALAAERALRENKPSDN